ncbi:MAG: phosphatase PAP2 family protein [Gemmataceae bacterium]|nr:phosphatase PAP2 family protein [Gemmataceae bacterium]
MHALTLTIMVAAAATAQPASGHDMVIRWNETVLQAIRADRSSPPIAARSLAIVHLAIYDAVMAIERTHQHYLVDLSASPGTSSEAAAAAAAHRCLISLYPKQREFFDLMLIRSLGEIPVGDSREQGVSLGRHVAERILAARQDDGSMATGRHELRKTLGAWQPTVPNFHDALLPAWGKVTPFAIRKGTQYQPPAPPTLGSAEYADAFHEVKRLGGKHSLDRTSEQTQIAHFWAGNVGTMTPPGQWNKISQGIAIDRGTSLAENARVFAHLNVSMADAAILCWVIKFTFDYWRPSTAITLAEDPATPIAESWTPLLETPPFPAYISGHSTFSAAAASVLAQSFGTDKIRFSVVSDDVPGATRKFDSLWAAAEEAGMSRIYGGIHWQFDNREGLIVGRRLGEYVHRSTLRPRR